VRILVAGMVATDPHQGGATWAVLQYVRGFEELGHEVWLVDPGPAGPDARRYFAGLRLGPRATLGRYDGPTPDVLVNISGLLRDEDVLEHVPIRVYVDLDPFFNQAWHAQGIDVGLERHTHHVTIGRSVPATGHEWVHTLPPVVLSSWPVAGEVRLDAFTTVANLRSYGTVEVDGVRYGQKVHALRTLIDLPQTTPERLALALDAHPDEPDVAALREHGWELLDPRVAAGTPDRYAEFVRGAKAELGVTKEGYVTSRCGWFSDRSAVYLASGRPVVAHDTGFGESLPVGAGLLAFADTDGARAEIEAVCGDYGRHSRAARAIAEEYLDARIVLARILREVGAAPVRAHRPIRDVPKRELAEALGVEIDARRPFEYRSSAPLTELDVGGQAVLLKDLARESLVGQARAAKLPFLHDPRREIEVYRALLAGAGLETPELHASVVDPRRCRFWLAIEKVTGVPLYQVELAQWDEAARWLARLHERFAGLPAADYLARYDRSFFELWPERAEVDLPGYDAAVNRLARLPTTLVHGDLYPSNMLIGPDRVCAIDWELAGIGPGVLDLAALTLGLADADVERLAQAYRNALARPPDASEFAADLDCARLHLAVQWLGWSPDWTPPPEHAHDWRAKLPALAERAGL
jgi:hypothetical protein